MKHLAKVVGYVEYENLTTGPVSSISPDKSLNWCDWHVLAEGDSWFSFNKITDLNGNLLSVLEFEKPTAICNLSFPGDNVAQMMDGTEKGILNKKRVAVFKKAVASRKWHMFLLSAGGNDLIDAFDGGYSISDNKKVQIIKKDTQGNDYLDYIDTVALKLALDHIKECYQIMIDIFRSDDQNKRTKIISHTYDYFTIRDCKNKKDKSIRQAALEKNGVPRIYWKQIVTHMNLALSEVLLSFNDHSNNIYIVRTLDTLTPADEQETGYTRHWRNEIHPNREGYTKLAQDRINQYLFP